MQKSNDNEIVQYLGVKHIINYLGVQVGLTQTLHFRRLLAILCLGHMEWGGGGRFSQLCLSQTVCVLTCTHMSAPVCVWRCICVRACVYICEHMSVGIRGGLNICMYANAYSVCLADSSGEMSALKHLEVEYDESVISKRADQMAER